jgi:hypothetical protein
MTLFTTLGISWEQQQPTTMMVWTQPLSEDFCYPLKVIRKLAVQRDVVTLFSLARYMSSSKKLNAG